MVFGGSLEWGQAVVEQKNSIVFLEVVGQQERNILEIFDDESEEGIVGCCLLHFTDCLFSANIRINVHHTKCRVHNVQAVKLEIRFF
jgi:hypothetical protein